MPTASPLNPKVRKGAIVSLQLPAPMPRVIPFQYNPETLTRSLEPQGMGDDSGDRAEALRIKGAPKETIKFDAILDASDALEADETIAKTMGVYPLLSALELLVYPTTQSVIQNSLLLAAGTIEIAPPPSAFTLLIWGPKRILPIRLTEFSITEEAYDPLLNPIRAKVSLGARVLGYNDFSVTHPGYHVFLSHQIVKETMAAIAATSSIESIAGGNVRFV